MGLRSVGVLALAEFTAGGLVCELLSNVDGCYLIDLLKSADPATTLFIVASKTFTRLKTLTWRRRKRRGVAVERANFACAAGASDDCR